MWTRLFWNNCPDYTSRTAALICHQNGWDDKHNDSWRVHGELHLCRRREQWVFVGESLRLHLRFGIWPTFVENNIWTAAFRRFRLILPASFSHVGAQGRLNCWGSVLQMVHLAAQNALSSSVWSEQFFHQTSRPVMLFQKAFQALYTVILFNSATSGDASTHTTGPVGEVKSAFCTSRCVPRGAERGRAASGSCEREACLHPRPSHRCELWAAHHPAPCLPTHGLYVCGPN